jgi:hypothetical protein
VLRDELGDDGHDIAAPPTRSTGEPRYGDRFRPLSPADSAVDTESETVDLGLDAPSRPWPTWLTRSATGLGVLAAALVAVQMGSGREIPENVPDLPAASSPLNDAPPVARLRISQIDAVLWDRDGFSYTIALTNDADTAYDLVDLGPTMSGTEMAWDRSLVLPAGVTTTVRVDYLVLNCLAATTSAAPDELRVVVRGRSAGSVTELARLPTDQQGAEIDAAGKAICAPGGGYGPGGTVLG